MMQPIAEQFISFYTYTLYTGEFCNTVLTIKEINRYENGKFQNTFLFPDHMRNFHGCKLTVCGHVVEPLLQFNGDVNNRKHLKDMSRLSGIEGEILKLVASTMNMKLEYRFTSNDYRVTSNDYSVRWDSNFTGCLADLHERRADMAIGGLGALMPNSTKFSISYTHHTSPYVFVVRGGRPFGPITQLLNPLQHNVWQAIVAQLLILIALINWIERRGKRTVRNFILGAHNKYSIHHLFVTLLGSPLPSYAVPRRNFARFLFIAWLLWTLELRNFYQGKMFDSLRLAKYQPTPKTIRELIERDYTLLSPHYADFYPRNKTVIISQDEERLTNLNNMEDMPFATPAILDFMAYYNMINFKSSTLTYVDEIIYLFHSALFFPKHSILVPSFNRRFKLLSDSGITSYVARQYIHPYFHNTQDHINTGDAQQITYKNLIGLIYIYIAMNGLSLLIFLMELGTKRFAVLKRIIEGLN
ncbi:uncharacterized protein LOC133334568 [Musca vetustissima]|uniref:uncharacterized protein LOC133334568 n=1 Tax=Musca vetustissima TaxID=27455 RepID=UPI002AB6BB35|nr:uncharacterized protein LOC133334568 [Musca vetustissima]